MTKHGSPPKALSAQKRPLAPPKQLAGAFPPKQPAGAFVSDKGGKPQASARRRRPLRAMPPPENENARLAAVQNHRNPLLEASRVLLRALADMPALIGVGYHETLRDLLIDEVRAFERLCDRANIRVQDRVGARYCLCTALDEAAMRALSINNAIGAAAWAADPLTRRIGEDNRGGSKIYALALHLLSDEGDHKALLEVMCRVFSLGFDGHYRQEATRGMHVEVRDRLCKSLYDAIGPHLPPVPDALSPNAQSDVTPQRESYFEIPVWMSAAVLSVALVGLYTYCRVDLSERANNVRQQIESIGRVATAGSGNAQDPR